MNARRRADWLAMSDEQLLSHCHVDTYRASGPGGQKRNKTSSAVRLRHEATNLIVIAVESRSQHENKARAVRRMRREIALQVREPVQTGAVDLEIERKDERFWPTAAVVLDALVCHAARVSDAAAEFRGTTARLIAFLQSDVKLWQRANELRKEHGQKPLH